MSQVVTLNVPERTIVVARQVADQTHRSIEDVLVEWIERRVRMEALEEALKNTQAEHLQNNKLGFSEDEWTRYHALIAKRRAETLTPQEHQELIAFSNQIEQANARRIAKLIELAKL